MLELKSVAKRFGEFAIKDISFEISGGEYFVLLGPSGVGKTVLIEMIAGLIAVDSGKVIFNGCDVTADPPESRRFAVVYQDFALFDHMTVAKNIAYGLRARGAGSQKANRRAGELAEMLGISGLLGRKPGKLSGGEKQRVALGRAVAAEPSMLLLDEPLSSLDTNTRLGLRKELKRICRDLKVPVLQTAHDPEEAMALGDKVGVMLGSGIRQVAGPEELFRRPSDPQVAGFLGMANVLPVSSAKGNEFVVMGQRINVIGAGDFVEHIWIRPEGILLSAERFDSSARNQFKCRVVGWDNRDSLLAVELECGSLKLVSLITYSAFQELGIAAGREVYATFKSSAVHCL